MPNHDDAPTALSNDDLAQVNGGGFFDDMMDAVRGTAKKVSRQAPSARQVRGAAADAADDAIDAVSDWLNRIF